MKPFCIKPFCTAITMANKPTWAQTPGAGRPNPAARNEEAQAFKQPGAIPQQPGQVKAPAQAAPVIHQTIIAAPPTTAAAGTPGPAGADGKDGANGTPGTQWYTGTTAPASTLGIIGDDYLNTATGDLYLKASAGWGANGNIRGPQGAAGTGGGGSAGGVTVLSGAAPGFPVPSAGGRGGLYLWEQGAGKADRLFIMCYDKTGTNGYGEIAPGNFTADPSAVAPYLYRPYLLGSNTPVAPFYGQNDTSHGGSLGSGSNAYATAGSGAYDLTTATNPAPAAVYNNSVYTVGSFTFTQTGFTPGANVKVRVHMVDSIPSSSHRFTITVKGAADIVIANNQTQGPSSTLVIYEGVGVVKGDGSIAVTCTCLDDDPFFSAVEFIQGGA